MSPGRRQEIPTMAMGSGSDTEDDGGDIFGTLVDGWRLEREWGSE